MDRIRVHIVKYGDCKNLVLRYIDPVTGKPRRSTKYVDPQTGIETPTGDNRKQARKLAALWEADLNAGRDPGRCCTGWQQFRLRYESEVVPGFAVRTSAKVGTTFNAVERILPKVAGGKLTDLNPEAISRLQQELRAGGLAETTIASYFAHLRSALVWAVDQGMIPSLPKIKRPQRAKKGGRARKSKGRPITAEEFDRLIAKIPAALVEWRKRKREAQRKTARRQGKAQRRTLTDSIPVEANPVAVESWRHYLTGLWLSGLRLAESLQLYWDRSDRLCVELRSRRPMLRIPAECEKGHRDRLLPITPDFAAFLLTTPEADRHGRVFRPMMPSGNPATDEQAGRMVALIGELARVVVHTDPKTGKVKFASAHDLRRSFGNRWAKRVMPAVLQKLMRHESIETSMGYYVDLDADELAEDLYRAHEKGQSGRAGTVSGTVDESEPAPVVEPDNASPYGERDLRK
jgi:integrase